MAKSRLGFPVKSNDARRWQSGPRLGVTLQYLDAIFDYLSRHRIDMYRMTSDLMPYAAHPDLAGFTA